MFQRFITEELQGLEYCFPDLNGILIASETHTEHMQHLRDYGVIINKSKGERVQ